MSDPRPTKRPRVLLIDSDARRAGALGAAMAASGAEVATVPDGEAGWRRFAELKPTTVIATMGGTRGGAWFLRRVHTEYLGAPPPIYLLADGASLDALRGLEPAGVLLPPVSRSQLTALMAPAGSAEAPGRQAMRLRELFELSLFGGQLSRNLEALVARAALSFGASDCVVWTADGTVASTRALDAASQAGLRDACGLASRVGGTLLMVPDGELGEIVCDAGGLTLTAVGFGASPADGGIALITDSGQRFSAEARDALALLGRRLGGELTWMSAHRRVVVESERLREAALLDPLLGVMNRAAFEQAGRAIVAGAERRGEPVVLAVLDLCGLRSMNERFGHQVGDRALAAMATTVLHHVRASDTVGRIGGDELGLWLAGTDLERARVAVDKVLTALAASPLTERDQVIPLGASAGLTPVAGTTEIEVAFARARTALKRAHKAPGAIQILADEGEGGDGGDAEGPIGLPAGSMLGGMYRILHELSRGAMGVVYRAEDLGLGRQVAIKLLRADLAGDRQLVDRFRREAAMLAALHHRNLVGVHAFGAEDDDVYFVMELVEGEPLSDVMERLLSTREAIELDALASVVEQIADALEAIHALGIVHRDVKPANVLIDRVNERAVLVDVGVARRTGEAIDAAGTPGYAAPECFLDVPETPASDVYGLAATAFAMLTGRPPYQDDNLARLVSTQMHEPPPPPSAFRPGLPAAVDAVLIKALAGRPADRYASAPAFALALTRAMAREPGAPAPQPDSVTQPHGVPVVVAPVGEVTNVLSRAPGASPRARTEAGPGSSRGGPTRPCRGAFFRVALRLFERELGAGFLRTLSEREPALAAALATAPGEWGALDDLVGLLAAAATTGADPATLAARIGRTTMSATLARYFGADPASMRPLALLRATERFWPRYQGWGHLAVAPHDGGIGFTLSPSPEPLACALVAGALARIAELAGARKVECGHRHGGASGCRFALTWAGSEVAVADTLVGADVINPADEPDPLRRR